MGKNPALTPHKIIAGCDCAYSKDGKIQICFAVLISLSNFKVIEFTSSKFKNPKDYIPGKFYLREGDISIETIKKLKNKFNLLFIDGHGKANVEGKGLACYIGENLKIPTIGIAKDLLFGSFSNLGIKRGSTSDIFYKSKKIGYALRSRENVKPIFISEGYNADIIKFKDLIVSSCKYRIPEPIRIAHILAKKQVLCNENGIVEPNSNYQSF